MGNCTRIWREHGQDSWPEVAKGIFHTTEHHAQYVNCCSLARSCYQCLGVGWAVCGEQMYWVSLVSAGFYLHTPRSPVYFHYNCYYFKIFFCFTAQLNTGGLLFIWIHLPISAGGEVGKWASGCVVLDCHLGLNCKRHSHFQQSIAEYLLVQTAQSPFVFWAAGPFAFPQNTEGLNSWVF